MRRDGKVQMVELAVGVAYLPRKDLMIVTAFIICNEVERRRTAKAEALIAIDVEINLVPSDEFHPLVPSDVDFSPPRRASVRKGIVIEWKVVRWVFNFGRERSRNDQRNDEGDCYAMVQPVADLLHDLGEKCDGLFRYEY